MSDLQQQLRDVILLEREWLLGHALRLSLAARQLSGDDARELRAYAGECRHRAGILSVAVLASAPDQPEAKAS
jgi:hypothetical protein